MIDDAPEGGSAVIIEVSELTDGIALDEPLLEPCALTEALVA
jgi:hypothetical protein